MTLQEKLKTIPKKPGCYLWKDKNGVVIYVGKTKNLFNRTHQYFNNKKEIKTFKLVEAIADIDYVVVDNENESLLLENNLISKYKPKFNILLRESNTFPYIVLTKEQHPRLLYVHDNKKRIKGTYYGPFASTKKYDLYNFINHLFPLRKCSTLPKQKCIYYDIGQCLGPCIKNIDQQEYEMYKKKINNFFNGKYQELDKILEEKELYFADKLDFENSQKYLELRNSLKEFSSKQDVIFSQNNDEDIIGFAVKENVISIVIFKYIKGNLLNKFDLTTVFWNDVSDAVESFVFDYYQNTVIDKPKVVNLSLAQEQLNRLSSLLNIEFVNNEKGLKKEIMLNAVNNASILLKNKYLNIIANLSRETNSLIELEKLLQIDSCYHIELFDNSNIFNENKVGAMVVYINGKKQPSQYRKYNIKNSLANSDYEYMQEIIYRRYKSLIKEKQSLPNLIIVDGGKPQITAALKSLKELNLDKVIPLIGLAKDNKHKTDRIIKSDMTEIVLDKKSDLFFFLLNMQDEVHRFAINFYRNKKSKSLFSNNLSQIKNLGKKRIEKLIKKFETIDNIKEANVDELSQIVPRKIAIEIKEKIK